MYTSKKRKVREAEKRVERLHFRFISDYVKVLHSDIYKKAEELYQSIRQKYPDGVKDLTKTFEYMNTVTPNNQVPRYYMSRKTKEKSTTKRMVLEIPLFPSSDVSSPPPHVSSPPPDVSLPPPHVSSPSSDVSSPPPHVSSPPPDVSLPPLSEEVFLQLLKDLHQDPDLSKILDGFPLDDDSMMDTTTDLQPDVWDSIRPQDISPLEQELCNVFM